MGKDLEKREKKPNEKYHSPKKQRVVVNVYEKAPGKGIEGSYSNIPLQNNPEADIAREVSEVIEKQAGLRLNRYGPPGTFSSLSVRGAQSQTTGIFIEGVPLNDPTMGSVNLENLPRDVFQNIEFYRSHTPLHLPGIYPGGALDLQVRKNDDQKNNESMVFLNSGIHSLLGGFLGAGLKKDNQTHYAEIAGSKNHYLYQEKIGVMNNNPTNLQTRKNEDFLRASYANFFNKSTSLGDFFLMSEIFAKENGLPGVVGNETSKVRLTQYRGALRGSLNSQISKHWNLISYSYLILSSSKLTDAQRELAAGFVQQERLNTSFGLGFSPVWFPFSNTSIKFLTDIRFTKILRDMSHLATRIENDLGTSVEFIPYPWLGGISGEAKIVSINDTAGKALKDTSLLATHGTKTAYMPSVYAKLGLFPFEIINRIFNNDFSKLLKNKTNNPLEIFVSVSVAKRNPSIIENYGDGGLLLPAPNLLPETSITNSIGIRGKLPCGMIDCRIYSAAFLTGVSDFILFIANSQKTMIAINSGKVQIKGFETDLSFAYKKIISLSIHYTLLNALDFSNIVYYNNKYLPFRPRHSFNFTIDTGTQYLRFFLGADIIGANYRDRYNSYHFYLPSRTRIFTGFNIIFENPISKLTFVVKNLTNSMQVDIIGYPIPGRVYEIMYSARFL